MRVRSPRRRGCAAGCGPGCRACCAAGPLHGRPSGGIVGLWHSGPPLGDDVEPRITLLTLGVRDLPRARRFYQEGLGWPLSSASTDDVAFLRTGGTVLALWSREDLAADAGVSAEGSGFSGV